MRTLDEVANTLGYHPANKDTAPVHDSLRHDTIDFATLVWDRIPDGPEKTLAMRGLQTFLMHANCAVAMKAPLDTQDGAVPRVLPPGTRLPRTMCSCEVVTIPEGEHSLESNRVIHRRPSDGACE